MGRGLKRGAIASPLEPKRPKSNDQQFRRWINCYPAVSKCLGQYDLERLLDDNGGIVKIPNCLPDFVAEGILALLHNLPDSTWNDTSAQQDYTHNNIDHAFWSTKQAPGLEEVFRVFSLLLPDSLHTFSAAKYCQNHHIALHDDRAYTKVLSHLSNI